MTSFLSGAGKSQRAGSLQLWRFCCCVWSARIVFNRSRVCERSFLSFSVSRLFSAYNLWKLPAERRWVRALSIERYLKKCRYSESVITGQNFARTRDALKSKQKHLKRLGKGNKPNEASSLTPEERDILFERKEMGFSSPKALINTLWLNNCMHFGLRGGKEQRELKWGDVVLKGQSFWKGIPRILYRKANQDTAWR